jgi:hypothetical protein
MEFGKAIARVGLAAAMAAAVLPIGCGPSNAAPRSMEHLSIAQIGQVFHVYQKGNKPPPRGPADLSGLQRAFPAAIGAINSRDVLVYWGVGFQDGPEAASTVLAYHKDVPQKGGEVLLQDGTSRTMTAEEFQAAKKPAGATTDFPPPAAGKARKR